MSNHTPGPWFHFDNGNYIEVTSKENGEGNQVADIYNKHDWCKNAEANARLIAAAPDLLEALQILVGATHKIAGTHGLAIDNARAAIAKAKEHSC